MISDAVVLRAFLASDAASRASFGRRRCSTTAVCLYPQVRKAAPDVIIIVRAKRQFRLRAQNDDR